MHRRAENALRSIMAKTILQRAQRYLTPFYATLANT
jgi:hypothetical protein